mmetsp:Transcript_1784/g.6371  ORF Transcript_1784/g.6371 Transcript_1784/m.6371 type:complete len:172 (-) Transcript_1784:49-564(-)
MPITDKLGEVSLLGSLAWFLAAFICFVLWFLVLPTAIFICLVFAYFIIPLIIALVLIVVWILCFFAMFICLGIAIVFLIIGLVKLIMDSGSGSSTTTAVTTTTTTTTDSAPPPSYDEPAPAYDADETRGSPSDTDEPVAPSYQEPPPPSYNDAPPGYDSSENLDEPPPPVY